MSRYDWPAVPAGEGGDDPAGRARYNARRRTGLDADAALRVSRTPQQPSRRPGGAPGPFAPASGRKHLWQPLGPATLLGGQAEGKPRVSGRVNAICVHDAGLRAYAASANGGVWYSKDGGANWVSVGGLASTNTAGILRPAQRNACGAVHVEFGAVEGEDEVFLGTGEVTHEMRGQPGYSEGGTGIFAAHHPLKSTLPDPWVREAPNLVNDGVYRIVQQPGGSTVIAATRSGLYQRPAAPGADKNWERPTSTPFDALTTDCTDLLWTPAHGSSPARLWVWVKDGLNMGLWVRDDGAPDFVPVAVDASPYVYTAGRASLAASTPPTQVWMLNDRGNGTDPALFRVTNPATGPDLPQATGVVGVPNILRDSGFYNISIAVDPTQPSRVALAGSYLGAPNDPSDVLLVTTLDGATRSYDASIVVADVAPDPANAGMLTYGLSATPYTMIGIGVHPDVHALAYSNNGASLWACCDGGIVRSDRPTASAGFYSRNHGLSISESNYVAVHPNCEGHLIAGLQDNGVVMRRSSGVWEIKAQSDGGGVAFDPLQPDRYLRQFFNARWHASDGVLALPVTDAERDAAAFYSTPATIAHWRGVAPPTLPNVRQLILGTQRVWYTEDFGSTWFTLPSGTAAATAAANTALDDVGAPITVCRWQNPDVAWVLSEQRLKRYVRTPGSDAAGAPGTWTAADVMPAGFVPTGMANKRPPAPPSLLDSAVWTDIAVNVLPPPAAGQPEVGAIYIGTVGHPDKANVDTLWWYDGTANWFPTGLRTNAVPAPVIALVVDATAPDEVWAGTTVGVWKGKRTQAAGQPPEWAWEQFVNGLPEAAVEDLTILRDGNLVLLRAAIASRGIWELRLDVADVQDLTYVRVHDDDLRYRDFPVMIQRNGSTPRSWHGSPDVRPRTAPAAVAAPASFKTAPWQRSTFPKATESLRRFQAAFRSSTGDPRIVATGTWDAYFSEVLRDHGAPTVAVPAAPPLPALSVVQINKSFWNAHMKATHATAEAWSGGVPTEADLYELTPNLTEGELASTSCSLPARPAKIDIVVHHRGLASIDGANIRVTLLKWIDPKSKKKAKPNKPDTWFTDPIPWADAVNEVLNSDAGTTTQTFAAGWSFVGSTNATRRPTLSGQTLDALQSGIVTFDLNLTGLKKNTVVLLVAIIRAGTDPIALTAKTLEALTTSSPNVAVRSLSIRA